VLTSDTIGAIAASLAKAQAIIENPAKAKTNPHFRSKHADLGTGIDCIRPALAAQEIAIVQAPETRGNSIVLHMRLFHS
jgi:hypothetical protein